MSNTLPEIKVGTEEYLNLNIASGLAVGTPTSVSNKGTSPVLLQISDTQPDASSNHGVTLGVHPSENSVKKKILTSGGGSLG